MRIGENLEVRISQSGKSFQIVATGGRREWAFASFTRDIGDQIFNNEAVLKNLIETYNEVRDSLVTAETAKNDFQANQHEAKVYRATPNTKVSVTAPKTAIEQLKQKEVSDLDKLMAIINKPIAI